mgnify:CR=1 FL=1
MNIGVIFAGGVGKRMNSRVKPKQFLNVYGKPIIIHTLEVFDSHPDIDAIVVACLEEWIPYLNELIDKYNLKKVKKVVPGGKSGQESIYHGLLAAEEVAGQERSIVLIHDGVRPLVDRSTIVRNIRSVETKGSAITVTPAIETVMVTDDGEIKTILNRQQCLMAKAPQSFRLVDILSVHDTSIAEGIHDFIDSASMMMHYGYTLYPVLGETENIKITTPSDYYMFTGIIKNRELGGLEDE